MLLISPSRCSLLQIHLNATQDRKKKEDEEGKSSRIDTWLHRMMMMMMEWEGCVLHTFPK